MDHLKSLLLLFLLLPLCQCATTPEPAKVLLPKSQSSYSNRNYHSEKYNDIDVNLLLAELEMDHPIEAIGYQEKSFNTCKVLSNKSPAPFCQRLYVGRLNFQVMCRDSTGTVEKVRLTPLKSGRLRWKKAGKRGLTSTNSNGFGSLGFVTSSSSKRGKLYLYLGSKIALKRFSDNWRLILPKSWCTNQ